MLDTVVWKMFYFRTHVWRNYSLSFDCCCYFGPLFESNGPSVDLQSTFTAPGAVWGERACVLCAAWCCVLMVLCVVWYCVVLCGAVCCVLLCGAVCCVLCGAVWCCVVLCAECCVVWCCVAWCSQLSSVATLPLPLRPYTTSQNICINLYQSQNIGETRNLCRGRYRSAEGAPT